MIFALQKSLVLMCQK